MMSECDGQTDTMMREETREKETETNNKQATNCKCKQVQAQNCPLKSLFCICIYLHLLGFLGELFIIESD